jgi:hypothetical protein
MDPKPTSDNLVIARDAMLQGIIPPDVKTGILAVFYAGFSRFRPLDLPR